MKTRGRKSSKRAYGRSADGQAPDEDYDEEVYYSVGSY